VFATLLGPYPASPNRDPRDVSIPDTVAELAAAGLEPVGDGLGARPVGRDEDVALVLAEWQIAASSTGRAVKASLVGPHSAAGGGRGRGGVRNSRVVEPIRRAIDALAAAGCPLIEIWEPAAVEIGEDHGRRRRFGEAHRALTSGLDTAVHLSLVVTGGNADTAGAATFFDLPYHSYAFDLIAGPDNWRLIAEAPGDRGIVCGALDPAAGASDRPEVLVWAAHYAASTAGRGLVRVGLANASPLTELTRERARRKVEALADAARIASVGPGDKMAALLDPRAVDSRSAAFGRYVPRVGDEEAPR
jgi:methionine synthase II (cobalamin-independent)